MLTLTGQTTIGDTTLYRDDEKPFTWYYMPGTPKVALRPDGKPVFSLVLYRRDLDRLTEEERVTKIGGGILTVTAELRLDDHEREAVLDGLVDLMKAGHGSLFRRVDLDDDELRERIVLKRVPIDSGNVEIGILAETAGGEGDAAAGNEFVGGLLGGGAVSRGGNNAAAIMAKLTYDGAILLKEMVEQDLPGIRVDYEFKFRHRLLGVKMVVWGRAKEIHDYLSENKQSLTDSASFSDRHSGNSHTYSFSRDTKGSAAEVLAQAVVSNQLGGVRITGEGELSAEDQMALLDKGMEMYMAWLADTFLSEDLATGFEAVEGEELEAELPTAHGKKYGRHSLSQYSIREWHQSMESNLNFTLEAKTVLEGAMPAEGNLAGLLDGHDISDFVVEIDIDDQFFNYLDLEILCTVDFENAPVDLVKVHIDYDHGDTHKVQDFTFDRNDPHGKKFAVYKPDADANSYHYDVTIFYKGSSEQYSYSGETDETILVLDADAIGVLEVETQIGLVNWDQIQAVQVDLAYGLGTRRHEIQQTFDKSRSSEVWQEVIGHVVDQPYEWQATFLDADNQRIEGKSDTSRSPRLVVNQPFENQFKMLVVAAGNFKKSGGKLASVNVALRYEDPANDYVVEDIATITNADDTFDWVFPVVDKELTTYSYQVTAVYSDGVVRADQWVKTDLRILPVGDPFEFWVLVNPMLLKLSGKWALGTIRLSYTDPETGTAAENTLQIEDFGKSQNWYFRVGDRARHTYRYQLTLYSAEDGSQTVLPEGTAEAEILVLRPPEA